MRIHLITLSIFLTILSSCVNYTYYVDLEDKGLNQPLSILHHEMSFKVKSIDGKDHKMKGIFVNDKHAIYMNPGNHTFKFNYCNCSGAGATMINKEFEFTYAFKENTEYMILISGVKGSLYSFGSFKKNVGTNLFTEKVLDIGSGQSKYWY